MVNAPKARDGTDLLWWSSYGSEFSQLKFELDFMSSNQKLKIINGDYSLSEKLITLHTYKHDEVVKILIDLGLPKSLQYILCEPKRLRLEGLDIPFALLWLESRGERPKITFKAPLPAPKIHGLSSWVWDSHVRIGRQIIKIWKSEIPELAKLKMPHVHSLLFTVETGQLAKRAVFSFSKEIEEKAIMCEWPEGTTKAEVEALLKIVRDNLPRLHRVRQELVVC